MSFVHGDSGTGLSLKYYEVYMSVFDNIGEILSLKYFGHKANLKIITCPLTWRLWPLVPKPISQTYAQPHDLNPLQNGRTEQGSTGLTQMCP